MLIPSNLRGSILGLCLLALAASARAQGSDSCSTPTVLSGPGPYPFNSTAATTGTEGQSQAVCNFFGSMAMQRDIWFTWTAAASGNHTVSLCGGATYDSKLAVYPGSGCPSAAALACNDDSCGLVSQLVFPAVAGSNYTVQIASFGGASGGSGTFQISLGGSSGGCTPPSAGPDVIVGEISDIGNHAAAAGIDAFSLGTVSCNIGDAVIQWQASNPLHPVIGGCAYKYSVVGGAGRFEQIGMSWLKHGFLALTGSVCCSCIVPGSGALLGIGCSDPYGAGLNGSQPGLGPRWQVNAHSGVFTYPPANPTWAGSTARRCQMNISELEPSNGTTVRYFGETQYVTQDDATAGNQNNNASWRELTCSGTPANFTFAILGTTHREESALRAWQTIDTGVVVTEAQVVGDGLFLLGSRATDLGGGTWHYEYAVYNMNADRAGGSFRVPIAAGLNVTNIGFHDVDYRNGDGPGSVSFSGANWVGSVSGGFLTWACETQAANPSANAIRWGTTYNFRFDVDAAPLLGFAELGLWKVGAVNSLAVSAQVPGSGNAFTSVCFGDGSGTACPCANHGATGNGCGNSLNGAGGNLSASGSPSVSSDTVVLAGGGMTNSSVLYFQGSSLEAGGLGVTFGDGLRCAGATHARLLLKTNAGGASQYPEAGDPSVSSVGFVNPGDSRVYQAWYRDAADFCGTRPFNLTNAVQCTWTP